MNLLWGWRAVPATLALVLVSLGLVLSSQQPAAAQNAADIASIDLEPLRSTFGASSVPYRITVVSDRAVEGTLQIRVAEQSLTFEFPLALAANTEISQLVAIPVQNEWIGEISVNLLVDGTSVAERTEFGGEGNVGTDFVAGVLGLDVTAAQAQAMPPVGTVTNVEIDDLRIISALDLVVSSPAALRTLTSDEQTQLFTWVGSGGLLVVADDAGTIDDLLPQPWQGDDPVVLAGVGELHFVGADWEEALPPPLSTSNNGNFFEFGATDTALASDAGFRVPSIGLLALVLLGYLFVIGPVTFVVLAKINRQTLAWLAIPALAVLFGVVIVGAGRVFVSGRSDAYASIVTVTPAGTTVSSTLLLSNDGNQTIDLPAGWSTRGNGAGTQFGFGPEGGGTELVILPSRATTELSFAIDTGSAAVVRVDGVTPDTDMPFAFADLAIAGDTLSGTVTNQSGVDLSEVAVFVGSNAMYVESLNDGEALDFDVQLQPAARETFPETREWGVRFDFRFGFEEPELDEDGAVNGAHWMRWRLDNFGSAVPDGLITAVGWSRDLDQYSLIGGEGRTALVQHAELPASQELTSGQIRRTIPRAPTWQDFEGFGRDFGEGIPTQFILPPGSSTAGLAIETAADVEEVAFLVDGQWRYLDLENHPTARTVTIPEEAWSNDRLTTVFGFGGFGFDGNADSHQPRIVVADDDAAPGVLVPEGERSSRPVEFVDDFGNEQFGDEFGPEFLGEELVVPRTSREDLNFEQGGFLEGTWDAWSVLVEPGDTITVTMRSNNLDSLLIINTDDGDFVAENDDALNGNMGLDSQIVFTVDEWAVYVIETRPLFGPADGAYTVFIDVEASGDDSLDWIARNNLDPGETDEWPVALTAGEPVQVQLVSDDDFVEMTVLDPDGAEVAVEEVDGLGAFAATVDGEYVISLTLPEEAESSNYELALTTGAG